jgi:hypothetical protein
MSASGTRIWTSSAPTPRPSGMRTGLVLAAVAWALAAGLAAAWSPMAAVAGASLLALAVLVAAKPAVVAYLLLGVTPLVAGLDRGELIPLVRPHEALALLLGSLLAIRGALRIASGARTWPKIRPLELAMLGLAVTSSVLPVLWLLARGLEPTMDDLLHALTLWKYFGLYVIVRSSVRTEREVARCLWVALGSAGIVAVVAILQSLQVLGVPQLLATHYAPFGNEHAVDNARGTSTLASSIAVADLMAYTLAISLAWLLRGSPRRGVLVAISLLLAAGALGSGQFSGVIALLLSVVAVGWVSGQFARAFAVVAPAGALGALLLWPVIQTRLSGFDSPEGLPHSWVGRLENLRTYFWPELFSDWSFVLGVRPSSRLAASESWRDWIWIESGHTWLLWAGGLPLFAAFTAFVWIALRDLSRVALRRSDAIGVAGIAGFAAVCVLTALMVLDQHLTLRGSADLLFPLLALALTGSEGNGSTSAVSDLENGRRERP